ncbi:hypothetical protein M2152_001929 [Microbacteriaceae bacterium SG_E_30_P1]|uniref:Transcriptional regulator, AbiEi antitoxin, Type IV TA system n=1 Tax=Antiquaquibacter oligotrophicus TaxID=2880260 RepID=A0ABT6KP16_9MICO|nr:hypothetical protein [Antiquaquibacter oligotrophicus]MDH6181747.1 hypothetical protein [Antiquaquibacter oligotrophicus]UDF12572.1 hypothetical protein LH407_10455 [Antiquaquibacter oligotrophicus]
MTYNNWHNHFVLAARERELGRTAELAAEVRSGALVRVTRGVYRRASTITSDPQRLADDAYLAKVRAAQLLALEPLVFSGLAAARVWDLPIVGSWPDRVSVSVAREAGGRSNSHLARSYIGYPPPSVERDGLVITSLARTVADVARTESFVRAVAMVDAALRGSKHRKPVSKDTVFRVLEGFSSAPGVLKAAGAVHFGDAASGSPGESCSRAGIRQLGFPAPVLQQPFSDRAGLIGIVDFWWPHCKLVGEFDGRGKYLREEFTQGRPTAEIVVDEKVREDRLRALGFSVTRWDWPVALSLPLLEAKLRDAGLR